MEGYHLIKHLEFAELTGHFFLKQKMNMRGFHKSKGKISWAFIMA